METYINGSKERFKEFMALPVDKPLKMLNLLKFKDKVEGTNLTGKEQYKIYMKAAAPFIEKTGAKVLFYGDAKFTFIGPEGLEWDKVVIVEYEKKEDFIGMVMQKEYPGHLRTAALADSRLILCE